VTLRRIAALALVLAVALGACSDDGPGRDDAGQITSAGDLSVFDLQVGDCVLIDDELEAANETLPVVPCDEPHQAEVYALVDVDDLDQYPGERELSNRAETECVAEFADYVGVDLADSVLFFTYMIPSIRSWQDDDDRTVVCMVLGVGGPLEGSVRGAAI
jgi:hypothetical protein